MFVAYKVNEINQNRFYQIPKELVENPNYNSKLNSDAKLLYALLLDRMELSRKNNWINENGEIYLLYSRENIQEALNISKPTAVKAFKQLTEAELIKEVRQGLGKPNVIYIGKIKYPESLENTKRSIFFTSGSKNSLPQEVKNLYPNDTECNDTDVNDTDLLRPLKKDDILHPSPKDAIPSLVNLYDSDDPFIKEYLRVMSKHGLRHKKMTEANYDDVISKVQTLQENFTVKEFSEGVQEHFDNLPKRNDGDIIPFLKASMRYFNERLDL